MFHTPLLFLFFCFLLTGFSNKINLQLCAAFFFSSSSCSSTGASCPTPSFSLNVSTLHIYCFPYGLLINLHNTYVWHARLFFFSIHPSKYFPTSYFFHSFSPSLYHCIDFCFISMPHMPDLHGFSYLIFYNAYFYLPDILFASWSWLPSLIPTPGIGLMTSVSRARRGFRRHLASTSTHAV